MRVTTRAQCVLVDFVAHEKVWRVIERKWKQRIDYVMEFFKRRRERKTYIFRPSKTRRYVCLIAGVLKRFSHRVFSSLRSRFLIELFRTRRPGSPQSVAGSGQSLSTPKSV